VEVLNLNKAGGRGSLCEIDRVMVVDLVEKMIKGQWIELIYREGTFSRMRWEFAYALPEALTVSFVRHVIAFLRPHSSCFPLYHLLKPL
jgi:hypothetical protein